jgi:acyl dehydratase
MALDTSLVGKSTEPRAFSYGWKELALYALGCGAPREELDYLYEGRGPHVLPSFAVVPMFQPMFEALDKTGCNLAMVVHGAQRVKIRKPLPASGTVHTTASVSGIFDLRRFAILHLDTRITDNDGALLAETRSQIIGRGDGGFGGQTPPKDPKVAEVPKDRAPDFVIEETTRPEQALLYRLSGDYNPLHADPEFAKNVGFEQGPILHGLCTYGYMVRHAAKGALGGDARRIVGIDAQFKKPVWPGDTLETRGWRVSPNLVALEVHAKGRDGAVIGGAHVEHA